jgi:hypothetical protein
MINLVERKKRKIRICDGVFSENDSSRGNGGMRNGRYNMIPHYGLNLLVETCNVLTSVNIQGNIYIPLKIE